MFNITGKYVKIWEVDIKDKMVLVQLSTSKKEQDGSYTNSSYTAKFVGKAYLPAAELQKGDTIEIKSGLIGKRKYQDKWYDDVVIFSFEVMEKKESSNSLPDGFQELDDPELDDDNSDDIPF